MFLERGPKKGEDTNTVCVNILLRFHRATVVSVLNHVTLDKLIPNHKHQLEHHSGNFLPSLGNIRNFKVGFVQFRVSLFKIYLFLVQEQHSSLVMQHSCAGICAGL